MIAYKTFEEAIAKIDTILVLDIATCKLKHVSGISIAHVLAQRGAVFPLYSELLSLEDSYGDTVAMHMTTRRNYLPNSHPLIRQQNKLGYAPIDYMVSNGVIFEDDDPIYFDAKD